jgi:uncharacterized protein with WD repeat
METKICTKCQLEKPITEFNDYVKTSGIKGKIAQCKACRKRPYSYWKNYYEKHKKEVDARQLAYRKRHREVLKRRSREQYQKNKEHRRAYNKKYYQEHKKAHKETVDKYRQKHKKELRLKQKHPSLKKSSKENRRKVMLENKKKSRTGTTFRK